MKALLLHFLTGISTVFHGLLVVLFIDSQTNFTSQVDEFWGVVLLGFAFLMGFLASYALLKRSHAAAQLWLIVSMPFVALGFGLDLAYRAHFADHDWLLTIRESERRDVLAVITSITFYALCRLVVRRIKPFFQVTEIAK